MLGLFGTLNLGIRSLSVQRQGIEIAGHNLANVNNTAYSRQRLAIESSIAMPTPIGPEGTGADGVAIIQIRNALLDRQVQSETSVGGSLQAQQEALQYAQANLGQLIDRQSSGAEGTAAAGGTGGQHGLAENLSDLFNGFQSLSTNPTSLAERQVLLIKAQTLTTQFNQVALRFDDLRDSLNGSLRSDVDQANLAISEIAKLNDQIAAMEVGGTGEANDLRDNRQQRLEDLAKLVDFTTVSQPSGAIDIVIGGVTMTDGPQILDQLETYDAGGGQYLIRAQTAGTAITPTSGRLQGTIEARDGSIADLRSQIDTLASELIASVNGIHVNGYGLQGSTNENFFSGTDAASIRVSSTLTGNPALVQASGDATAPGDNSVMLQLAQLGQSRIASLNNQTFGENYGQSVASLGQSLSSINTQITNQDIVSRMLLRQRDSISGVSLDEEMTDLIKYQRAFEASARLITTIDAMLDTVLNLKR